MAKTYVKKRRSKYTLKERIRRRDKMNVYRDVINEGIRRNSREHPEFYEEKVQKMWATGAIERTREKRLALRDLAEQAGCKIDTRISNENIEKCMTYFKTLIEKRDKLKESGSRYSL